MRRRGCECEGEAVEASCPKERLVDTCSAPARRADAREGAASEQFEVPAQPLPASAPRASALPRSTLPSASPTEKLAHGASARVTLAPSAEASSSARRPAISHNQPQISRNKPQ